MSEIEIKCICRTFEENGIKKMWYSREYVQQLKAENEAYKNSILANLDSKITRRLEEVLEENEKLKKKLNEYEDYGGIIDEGQAWADEAMESREKLKQIEDIVDQLIKVHDKMGGEYKDYMHYWTNAMINKIKVTLKDDEPVSKTDNFKNGELVWFTDFMGVVWHSDKVVQELKKELEEWKERARKWEQNTIL